MDVFEKVKLKTKEYIEMGELDLAKKLLSGYQDICKSDVEMYSIKGIIEIIDGDLYNAERTLLMGYSIDNENFDILYNIGYFYEIKEEKELSSRFYGEALSYCSDEKLEYEIKQKIQVEVKDVREKLVFFVKEGMDAFLDNIVVGLSKKYIVKKIIVNSYNEIDIWSEWADICWFEWCDELVIYGSKLLSVKNKRTICRIHSYEVFVNHLEKVNWGSIDKIIFVSKHIRDTAIDISCIDSNKTKITPNGLKIEDWSYKKRYDGFNIAYVGYINYKKGPMLLIQTFKKIYDLDNRYKLYIAGEFQDLRDKLYFTQMSNEMGISENIIFTGWQEDLNEWLDDKNYILVSSLLESQHMSIMQAMAKGIKPIIHNFVGAVNIYPKKYLWNTIDEVNEMLKSRDYNSLSYREFIEKNYDFEVILKLLEEELRKTSYKNDKIMDFNYEDIKVKFYLPYENDHIQKNIFFNQSFYELEMLEDIRSRIGEGKVIIDIGANIGNHSIFFGKICKAKKVFSFEPQCKVFDVLKKNININELENIVSLYNIGLGSEEKKVSLEVIDEKNCGSNKLNLDKSGNIDVKLLDDIVEERIDLIKIDVEGMELEVLKGAKNILSKYKPILYIEAATKEELEKIYIYLNTFGYKIIDVFNATPTYLFM